MPEDYCDHCDLPKSQCIHGRPVVLDEPVVDGPTITATQTSPCGLESCRVAISEGEQITHTDEGWIHTRHLKGHEAADASMFEGIE